MSNKTTEVEELDFAVEELDDGTWEVWTPDFCGACIGSGPTKLAAMESAVRALGKTAERIAFRYPANEKLSEPGANNPKL